MAADRKHRQTLIFGICTNIDGNIDRIWLCYTMMTKCLYMMTKIALTDTCRALKMTNCLRMVTPMCILQKSYIDNL